MAAPQVQKLEQIIAELNPAYKPQQDIYKKQISAVPGKYDALKSGLEVRKQNEFREISRGANARGMAFSGMPQEEQTRYLGESYLPALAGYDTQAEEERLRLEQAIASLLGDQRLRATEIRSGQQRDYNSWQEAERQRAFQRQEAERDRAFRASQAQLDRTPQINPAEEFLSYIASQFKTSGGQGNKNISRQMQDNWANAWFTQKGINSANDRQVYWDLFNQTYNRSNNPYDDWRYKR